MLKYIETYFERCLVLKINKCCKKRHAAELTAFMQRCMKQSTNFAQKDLADAFALALNDEGYSLGRHGKVIDRITTRAFGYIGREEVAAGTIAEEKTKRRRKKVDEFCKCGVYKDTDDKEGQENGKEKSNT